MQRDLERLQEWTAKWQMKISVEKCVILHMGHRNTGGAYNLNGIQLKETDVKKYLGVYLG